MHIQPCPESLGLASQAEMPLRFRFLIAVIRKPLEKMFSGECQREDSYRYLWWKERDSMAIGISVDSGSAVSAHFEENVSKCRHVRTLLTKWEKQFFLMETSQALYLVKFELRTMWRHLYDDIPDPAICHGFADEVAIGGPTPNITGVLEEQAIIAPPLTVACAQAKKDRQRRRFKEQIW
ncbi:hypothetical protein B0H14DRAFT_2559632 [Mycena olivaceomarginata]|nr:hypothetical protein B0H14DRAFT_2559632 [Mycena olivaceomarginata]